MEAVDFPFEAINTLTFQPRPQPLPASLRPIYRIALIILVLKTNCREKTASMLKLQFFNWLLKSSSLQKSIEERMVNECEFTLELIHLDPMVNLALNYAIADKLVSITSNSKYKLTDKGNEFIELILRDEQSVLAKERDFLIRIGQKISEVRLREGLP